MVCGLIKYQEIGSAMPIERGGKDRHLARTVVFIWNVKYMSFEKKKKIMDKTKYLEIGALKIQATFTFPSHVCGV